MSKCFSTCRPRSATVLHCAHASVLCEHCDRSQILQFHLFSRWVACMAWTGRRERRPELSTSRAQNYSNVRQSKGRANCDRSHASDVSDQGESEFLAYLILQ